MTGKILDWLNSNRFRAYPLVNDSGIIVDGKRIPDAVLLDCHITDTRSIGRIPVLEFTKIEVSASGTTVYFIYDGITSTIHLTGGGISGDDSFTKIVGTLQGSGFSSFVHFSFTFSSHAYLISNVGAGTWCFSGRVLPSKVVSITASGVSGITTNGSYGIQSPGVATGHVHLVDGYRTQPRIESGKVVVRVGTNYGYDPCHYQVESSSSDDDYCKDLLFFFCGQNAITSGNVVIQGGPGITVSQGKTYTAHDDLYDTYGRVGIHKGEQVPCVEVIASSELLNIYRPSEISSDSGSSS